MAHLLLPILTVIFFAFYSPVAAHGESYEFERRHAVCDLVPGSDTRIRGTIRMSQIVAGYGSRHYPLQVEVQVQGLDPSDGNIQHGIHVHTFGDVSDACMGAGGHYNPLNANHGAPSDPPFRRKIYTGKSSEIKRLFALTETGHVGDWGNVEEDAGTINTRFTNFLTSLYGPFNIAGRAIVIHENVDDLGRGGNAGSLASGNSGTRLACCIIRLVQA